MVKTARKGVKMCTLKRIKLAEDIHAICRVVKVPFEMELSSVQVPKIWWNCWNFSVQSSFPINKIEVKLELSSVQVPKFGWNCGN